MASAMDETGLTAELHTVALVGPHGRIDGSCVPLSDSPGACCEARRAARDDRADRASPRFCSQEHAQCPLDRRWLPIPNGDAEWVRGQEHAGQGG